MHLKIIVYCLLFSYPFFLLSMNPIFLMPATAENYVPDENNKADNKAGTNDKEVLEEGVELNKEEHINHPYIQYKIQQEIALDQITILNNLFKDNKKKHNKEALDNGVIDYGVMNPTFISTIGRPFLTKYHESKYYNAPNHIKWEAEEKFKLINAYIDSLPSFALDTHINERTEIHLQESRSHLNQSLDIIKNITINKELDTIGLDAPINHEPFKNILKKNSIDILQQVAAAQMIFLYPDVNVNPIISQNVKRFGYIIGSYLSLSLFPLPAVYAQYIENLPLLIQNQCDFLEQQPLNKKQKKKLEQIKRKFYNGQN